MPDDFNDYKVPPTVVPEPPLVDRIDKFLKLGGRCPHLHVLKEARDRILELERQVSNLNWEINPDRMGM